jgi:hypothetical protein
MKVFIKKVLIFLLPVLVLLVVLEYLLRKIPNDYSWKASVYNKKGSEFEILILGSSYALCDVNPIYFDRKTFNGGHTLQSLDMDKKIFDRYQEKLARLRYLIIPISYFSFLYKLEDSPQSFQIKNYSIYYDVPYAYKPGDHFELLNFPLPVNRARLISYYFKHKDEVGIDSLGYVTANNLQLTSDMTRTASKALKELGIRGNEHFEEERAALEWVIQKCAQKKIDVVIVIPPAYKTFFSSSDSAHLQATVKACEHLKTVYKNTSCLNFLTDTSFAFKDYLDASHLNESGAKKLSQKINLIIRDMENEAR